MEEEEKASGIAVLSHGYHKVNIVVLYKNVGYTVIVYNRILRLRISLHRLTKKKRKLKLKFFRNSIRSVELNLDLRE